MMTTATPASSQPDHSESAQTPRAFGALTTIGVLLFLAGAILPFMFAPYGWFTVARWAGLAVIAAGGWRRPSLTYWIFFAMLLGGEIGLDRPQFAEHLRVFSDIFLRLIKVIVAPLIFGTLVTGIAGHGNLRSVGRIGVKSLIYFEIVTTLALFIGLGAINLSRAGEGLSVTMLTAATEPVPSAAPLHWDDFLLHIFPGKSGEVCGGKSDSPGCGIFGTFWNCAGAAFRKPSAHRCSVSASRSPRQCLRSRSW